MFQLWRNACWTLSSSFEHRTPGWTCFKHSVHSNYYLVHVLIMTPWHHHIVQPATFFVNPQLAIVEDILRIWVVPEILHNPPIFTTLGNLLQSLHWEHHEFGLEESTQNLSYQTHCCTRNHIVQQWVECTSTSQKKAGGRHLIEFFQQKFLYFFFVFYHESWSKKRRPTSAWTMAGSNAHPTGNVSPACHTRQFTLRFTTRTRLPQKFLGISRQKILF